AAFLAAPHAFNPWTRMPDFKLSETETAALVAFLGAEAKGKVTAPAAAKVASSERGAKLFHTAGCVQCHTARVTDKPAEPMKKALNLAKGCLAAEAQGRGNAPDFHLAEPQARALRTFLATGGASLKRETAAEFSLRQMKALNCVACHRRDG